MPAGGRVVTGATRVAAVIGDPVRHSLSPLIHNTAFAACGLDWVYVALPVAAGRADAALAGAEALGIDGLSVTMPHKEAVAAALDRLTPTAARLGAVNCVFRDGGRFVGDNTDGAGLVAALAEEPGVDPAGASVVVLGAGGAARAVVLALAEAGAQVTVVARRADRAAVAAELAGAHGVALAPGAAADSAIAAARIVINATPVGMAGAGGTAGAAGPGADLPCDPGLFGATHVVADLIYSPLQTPWLAAAADRGARVTNGVGMLVHQAAVAFTRWTGEAAPIPVIRAAISTHLLG